MKGLAQQNNVNVRLKCEMQDPYQAKGQNNWNWIAPIEKIRIAINPNFIQFLLQNNSCLQFCSLP